MDTPTHHYPDQVLPNSSMYSSTPALPCGSSQCLPLVVPCCCPSAPGPLPGEALQPGPQNPPGTSATCSQHEQLQETNREDLPCATPSTVTLASFPNTCVQKIPRLQEALVLGMQHPANCSSAPKTPTSKQWWQQRI